MPITYSIDPARNLIRLEAEGTLTDEEVVTCLRALRADPELKPGMDTLSDMRGVQVAVTQEGVLAMKDVMDQTSGRRGQGRVATVTDSDVAFGMARMTQLNLGEGPLDYRVFREMDEALRWLESEPES